MATLPAQTRRFKLRISAILCKNSSDLFLDTKGVDHHERITRRTSPASQNLNDIEGAANANAKVLEVFARS